MARFALYLTLAALLLGPRRLAAEADPFAECEAKLAAHPDQLEGAQCFFRTGNKLGLKGQATSRLRRLLARYPKNPWILLNLGHLETERSVPLYQAAVRQFMAWHNVQGELYARANLERILFAQGRLDEAGAQVQRGVEAAQASKDPALIAQANIYLARHLTNTDRDLERAYLLLSQGEPALFPHSATSIQRAWFHALALVSQRLGRYQEAQDAFRRHAELAAQDNDRFGEASSLYGMAGAFLDSVAELPRAEDRERALALMRQAEAAAEVGNNAGVEAKAHSIIALLSDDEAEARRNAERCLAVAPTPRDQSYCLNALSRRLAARDPQAAREATDRSLALARQAEDPFSIAVSWRERMRVSWQAEPVDSAVADSWAALDRIEEMRDLQAGSSSQAQMFSSWSEDYYWFSGRLLQAAASGGGEKALERAFAVAERLRARSLVDALEAARAAPQASPGAVTLRKQRVQVLADISAVQKRLLDPSLPAAGRAAASRQLDVLEVRETGLRNAIAHADPAYTALRRPEFASLTEVRRALAPDEALFSFQIAPWQDLRGDFAGGSWLLVSTRSSSRAYRLPGRGDLRPAVRLFVGMFERRDASEVGPSTYLYRELLGSALAELPPGIRRLVVIPDDALHQLPFGALRSAPDAPPLAVRYQMSMVPSATLWLHWRQSRPAAAPEPALALADPPVPGETTAEERPAPVARERSAVFASAVRLGSLPYARRESRAVVRAMGGGSVRLLGDDASERFVKHTDLAHFGLLHFATHAVVDEQNPERSGVLLAPTGGEDGLLQIREIVDLRLGGRVVVLASCRSASGTLLRGEGVMGMARAFFQAGSHAVVASLWPLRDDEAAQLFDRFYDHLGRGDSLAAALQAAQRDLIAAKAPAAAWAGLEVLGDGDLVPLPGGRKLPYISPAERTVAVAVLALLAAGAALFWFRRRRRTTVLTVPPQGTPVTPGSR